MDILRSPQNSSPFEKDTIFKNPFDVPKEQLIRKLIPFPIYIASAFKSCNDQDVVEKQRQNSVNVFSLLASEDEEAKHSLTIEKNEEVECNKQPSSAFGNLYGQEKGDEANEAWQEGTVSGLLHRARKRTGDGDHNGIPYSSEIRSSVEVAVDESLTKTRLDASQLNAQLTRLNVASPVTKSKRKRQDAESRRVSYNSIVKEQDRELVGMVDDSLKTLPPNATCPKSIENVNLKAVNGNHEATTPLVTLNNDEDTTTKFIISVLRALRHAKHGGSQQLLDMLSATDIPVNRVSFLGQLIKQALCYNKVGIAKELTDYRNQLYNISPAAENM